ncbi:hypothetical protein K466DRAFT_112617 [Polyporus arcularius HHB13444]|uniref:Uncharacterized protein n=1 Tax=Polyporus arcularius HHB13444 TaxID=1314778 RepID=A0A5C3PDU2_9APHY|nr:hypothetical protein K466DRAFT_112617 [Polyporus arcularius HHB13444]
MVCTILRCFTYWTPPTQGPLPACMDRGDQIRDVPCRIRVSDTVQVGRRQRGCVRISKNGGSTWYVQLNSPRHRHLYLLQGDGSRCPHVLVHATMKDYDRMPAHADMAERAHCGRGRAIPSISRQAVRSASSEVGLQAHRDCRPCSHTQPAWHALRSRTLNRTAIRISRERLPPH